LSPSDVRIEPVPRSRSGIARFLNVPYGIYRDDPHWVAPLLDDLKKVFTDKNPFLEHSEMDLFVAVKGGRDVGRIAAILDHRHNEFQGEKTGFFGFYECENDPDVSDELFRTAERWLGDRHMNLIRGPMNPSMNDECGLLVEGFQASPVLMMTYNPRYYMELYERAGYRKAKDLLAYWIEIKERPMSRLSRLASGIRRREPTLRVRKIRKKTLAKDLAGVKDVYNAAWEKNWGFVPFTDGEIDFMASRLKPLLVEDLVLLAEMGSDPAGFMLTLPDYNRALKPLGGKLLPFGWLKFLLGIKKIDTVRLIALGFKKKYRMRGIDAVMFADSLAVCLTRGYKYCEVSWILEDNVMVQRPVDIFDGRVYKKYRIYEKTLGS
jgi:hypothetical protein